MSGAASAASAEPTWHLLQVSDALDEEFGSALSRLVPLMAWRPERHYLPFGPKHSSSVQTIRDPALTVSTFPLLRGFARFPWSALVQTGVSVSEHLLRHTHTPEQSPLICTSPYFAPVAERWPGPVVYWLTDLMAHYNGVNANAVHRLDARMCRVAAMVCPNSQRLAEYLVEQAACPKAKIHVLPNATRACNLLACPAMHPALAPEDMREFKRPVAGVIGNLAGNMDWLFLAEIVSSTHDFQWVFVGPTTMPIRDKQQSRARKSVLQQENALFVGRKPYGELAGYARAFDIAVLPYRRCEPTYSGSSTRFYEHLAACRPMIATRGFEELLHKEPLLRLVDTAGEAKTVMQTLRLNNFEDGQALSRWQASWNGTWEVRAACMVDWLHEVQQRCGSA